MRARDLLPVWNRSTPTPSTDLVERSGTALSMQQWIDMWSFVYAGNTYGGAQTWGASGGTSEEIAANFAGYVQACYRRNGVVSACLLARESLFSEARFQWRRFEKGRPQQVFGDAELVPLEVPWPNGTTGDLLVRMEQDSSIEGNFFGRRFNDSIYRLRPDWVSIILVSESLPEDPAFAWDARPIGYSYHPGGYNSGKPVATMRLEEVCHYAPRVNPTSVARGISLFESVLREVYADGSATDLKLDYFESGATPNTIGIVPIPDVQEFTQFVLDIRNREQTLGPNQKLWLQQSVDFKTIGNSMEEQAFAEVQGAGETRIAAALGVPPVIVGLREGLQAATYSNYELAMRRFADLTMRPLWRKAAGSLQTILDQPSGAQLWYDDRDIPALKDDIVKRAEVWTKNASAAKLLIDAGYEPDSVRDAIDGDDWSMLDHTGLPTVQVQKTAAITNGKASEDEEGTLVERAEKILGGART